MPLPGQHFDKRNRDRKSEDLMFKVRMKNQFQNHRTSEKDDLQKPNLLKRFFINHPLVSLALKWILISLFVVSLLYFTGGLAASPLLAPVVAKLGALSLLVFSPIIGGALATLWYSALKPISLWCASQCFSPDSEIPNTKTAPVNIQNPTKKRVNVSTNIQSSAINSSDSNAEPYHGSSPLHSSKKTNVESVDEEELLPGKIANQN